MVGDLRMWLYRATPGNPRQMRRRRPISSANRTPPPHRATAPSCLGGSRRFERHHLHATRLSLRVTRATEEVDARPHDLDDAAPLAVLFPVAAAQVAGDADALSLAE